MQRNIHLINVYSMCLGAIFVLPVLVPYYTDVVGLSLGAVSDVLHITIALLILAGFMAVTGGGLLSYWLAREPAASCGADAGEAD